MEGVEEKTASTLKTASVPSTPFIQPVVLRTSQSTVHSSPRGTASATQEKHPAWWLFSQRIRPDTRSNVQLFTANRSGSEKATGSVRDEQGGRG